MYAAAKLGLPDLVKDGANTPEELAAATGTHAPLVCRLLRALASIGVFAEDELRRFSGTALGATLHTDVPGSLRFIVIEELRENRYPASEKLLCSLNSNATAFNHAYCRSKWEYMTEHAGESPGFVEFAVRIRATTALVDYQF